jgi:hypothetical protein
MEASIMVNSHMINFEMGRESTLIQKTMYILEAGKMMSSRVKVYTCTPMDKYMMDWSKKVWWSAKESTTIRMVTPIMMALFIKTKSMEKDYTTVSKKSTKENGETDSEQVMRITIIKSIDKHI